MPRHRVCHFLRGRRRVWRMTTASSACPTPSRSPSAAGPQSRTPKEAGSWNPGRSFSGLLCHRLGGGPRGVDPMLSLKNTCFFTDVESEAQGVSKSGIKRRPPYSHTLSFPSSCLTNPRVAGPEREGPFMALRRQRGQPGRGHGGSESSLIPGGSGRAARSALQIPVPYLGR